MSWNANTEPDLAGYKIHYGTEARKYVESVDVKRVLKYVFSDLTEGQTYYFVVTAYDTAGNESVYSIEVSAQVPVTDKTPPALSNVRALDANRVEVQFSEPITQASAQKIANYTISPQTNITAAALQADLRTVLLTTAAHADGQTYSFAVKDIFDRATPANVIVQPANLNYEYHAADTTAPKLLSAKALNANRVEVQFSEPITQASAQKIANYTITPSINITAAALQADLRTVLLTTSVHADGQTYSLSVKDILDRATPANVIVQPANLNYEFHAADTTAPKLISAKAVNATRVEVQFSEPITQASAQKIANYTITPSINITAAALQVDLRTVLLTTAAHADGQTYSLAVKDIFDRATPANAIVTPASLNYEYHAADTTAPTLISAKALNANHVEVQFSEPITPASAQKIANYTITPLINITAAALQADLRTVLLTTAAHADGQSYSLAVKDIFDRATPANGIVQPASLNYEYHAADTTAPTLLSAKALTANRVEVQFSEPITQATAEQIGNYNIMPAIAVNAALLQTDTRTVILTTGPHVEGTTYTLRAQNIRDRATPANIISPSNAVSYTFQIPDTTAPALLSAQALDANTVEVRFSEPITQSSAEKIGNYTLAPELKINIAALQADARTVRLNTGAHTDGVTYTLRAQNILDRATPPNTMRTPATVSYQFIAVDTQAPSIAAVRALDHTKVEIRFDEIVARNSAENHANYTIDQGLLVTSAILLGDERSVLLETTPHTDGARYQITVRNIADRAAPPNVLRTPATAFYTFFANDKQPPRVTSVALANLNTLVITFDEKVTRLSAENTDNYRLSDNVRVLSAHLDAFAQEVALSTTEHDYNRDYMLSLSGIVDASANANVIKDTLRYSYRLQGAGGKQNGNLTIASWTPEHYAMDTLRVGRNHYVDLAHTITYVPARLRNLLLFRTANRDRQSNAEDFFEFNLNHLSDVYVVYDNRAQEAPRWLRENFIDNNQRITISMGNGSVAQMKVWKGRFSPGRVRLGGNMAAGVKAEAALNMYFVLVDDLDLRAQARAEQPKLFELVNNYPNPLKLNAGATHTVIECRLRQQSRVVLKVYNMLGQAVRTLHDGVLPVGTYPMIWNGRDEDGEPVPSGKYLYSLEILEEVQQGDFTLTASLNRQTRVMTVLR